MKNETLSGQDQVRKRINRASVVLIALGVVVGSGVFSAVLAEVLSPWFILPSLVAVGVGVSNVFYWEVPVSSR